MDTSLNLNCPRRQQLFSGFNEAQRSLLWSVGPLLSAYFQQLGGEQVDLDRYLVRNEPQEMPQDSEATNEPVEVSEVQNTPLYSAKLGSPE